MVPFVRMSSLTANFERVAPGGETTRNSDLMGRREMPLRKAGSQERRIDARAAAPSCFPAFLSGFFTGGVRHRLDMSRTWHCPVTWQGEDSFYVFLGLGYNINSYDPKDRVKETANSLGVSYDVEVDNTFALKVGGGLETFFTEDLAFNMEFGWKLNMGDAQEFVNGTEVLSGDFNGSALSVLIGLRYYLPL